MILLSICTTFTPDRTPLLIDLLLTVDAPVEICLAFWPTPDYPTTPILHPPAASTIMYTILTGPFCLGRGRNAAAALSTTPILVFIDADMLLPRGWLAKIPQQVGIPALVCPLYYRVGPNKQCILGRGWGNLALQKQLFNSVGGYQQTGKYGGEDTELISRLKQRFPGILVIRENDKMVHQYHKKEGKWYTP